jgi:hypothetical protein
LQVDERCRKRHHCGSCVVSRCEVVLVILATAGHGVQTRASSNESSTVVGSLSQTQTRSGEEHTACVRGPRSTREKRCRLQAWVPARRVPGRTTAGLDSCVRPEGGPRCLRQYPIEQALRQYPIEQDVRGRDAHVGVQHTCATAHSCCGLEGSEDSNLSIQRSQNAGGAARIQLRASAT